VQAETRALETLIDTNGLPVTKNTVDKVRQQRAGVASLSDLWWQPVWHDVEHMALTPTWKHWVDEVRRPLMSWQEHLSRTRCPGQKAQSALGLKAIQEAFEKPPCTGRLAPDVLTHWNAWAAEHARAFQRASAAVEGRNGYLSGRHHKHRGVPTGR
jgi:hypothetical protein